MKQGSNEEKFKQVNHEITKVFHTHRLTVGEIKNVLDNFLLEIALITDKLTLMELCMAKESCENYFKRDIKD